MMQSKTSTKILIAMNEGVPPDNDKRNAFLLCYRMEEERRSMDSERIKKDFFEIAKIGMEEDGSITRLLFSKEYEEALVRTKKYMEEAGLLTFIDSVGNLHGILKSEDRTAKTILTGSHLDTVIRGGMYDGLLGIIAGVEAAREASTKEIKLKHHLEVIAFNGEEGNDLGGTFGSRCIMGLVPVDNEDYLKKAETYGLMREDLMKARMDTEDKSCFLELHIEQGDTLEKNKEEIGIVKGIVGLIRYKVTALGQSNHAGTTMMEHRKDAMTGMAKLMVEADRLTREYGNHLVSTFGKVLVMPNAVAVIPGKVEAVLEIRNLSRERMEDYIMELEKFAREISDISFAFEKIVEKTPQSSDDRLIGIMNNICEREGISHRIMPSGATHDSVAMAHKMPIGMLFVPSKGGISHNGAEYTEWEQVMKGIKVFYETIKEVDKLDI